MGSEMCIRDRPWDEMLDQHTPGLQHRTTERPTVVIAALPRDDSPSADEYVRELSGRTTWTQQGVAQAETAGVGREEEEVGAAQGGGG